MKKIIARIALCAWVVLIAGAALAPMASYAAGEYIIADEGLFTADELTELNSIAQTIRDQTGIECFFAATNSDPEIVDYTDQLLDAAMTGDNAAILSVTDSQWYYVTYGDKAAFLTDSEVDAMWDTITENVSTYYEGARNYFAYLNSKMYASIGVTANLSEFGIYNSQNIPDSRQQPLLVDNAGVLSSSEYDSLLEKLENISSKQSIDVAVVTISSLNGQNIVNYADDFYDYNGYGQGANRDGILLLMSIGDRRDHVTTTGLAIRAFSDEGLDYMMSDVEQNYFADNDWYGGFVKFADWVDTYMDKYDENGEPYVPHTTFAETLPALLVALPAGLIPAAGIRKGMKNQLKSVRKAYGAERYAAKEGVQMYNESDVFLFRNVTKTRHIEPERTGGGGGGGSSTHVGSSGTSHGGRSGSF